MLCCVASNNPPNSRSVCLGEVSGTRDNLLMQKTFELRLAVSHLDLSLIS